MLLSASTAAGGRGNASFGSHGHGSSSGGPRGGNGSGCAGDARPIKLDVRLSDKEQNALSGTAITVRANFFPLKYPKDLDLYDYTVDISPARLFELLESTQEAAPYLDGMVYDGMQRLISRRRLPVGFSIRIPFYGADEAGPRPGGEVYTVRMLKPKILSSADLVRYLRGGDIKYNPLPIISAFNLITSAHASQTGVQIGKNQYYFPPSASSGGAFPLSVGLEVWKGFSTSVRPVYKNLMINVNACTSVFYTPYARFSDAMFKYPKLSYGEKFYRHARVTMKHLAYRKKSRIKGFGSQTARKTFFQCDELGGEVSVEQYFRKKYNIHLQYADKLPVINIGKQDRDVFVPAELCEIEPGQPFVGVLSESESQGMVQNASNPLYINAQEISGKGLETLGLRQRASPMPGFGIEVSSDMAVVPARVLAPPKVVYQSHPLDVVVGSWNLRNMRFYLPARLTRAAILILSDGVPEGRESSLDTSLGSALKGCLSKCRASGMKFDDAHMPLRVRNAAIEAIEKEIKSLPLRPSIILVFLSNTDQRIYRGLKMLCDVKLGIPTVSMQMANTMREKGRDQYFASVALKVNTKLGGVNHQLHASSMQWLKNTMLVGMDVTHPGVGCVRGTPSIAAVVASCDAEFMHYPASLGLQEHGKEMVTDLKKMMVERLDEYFKRMKTLPERVVVFRDGVSEGEFVQVLVAELPEIKAAFLSFKGYNPKLTIAICGKGHHVRFYPTRTEEADRTANTRAGTLVDRGVTGVYDSDFYLQAHAGLQGTVRSTHYTVIFDENRFSADALQQGVHTMSYLWAPATKSVSLIPPAYWADRACERGRLYLHGIMQPSDGDNDKCLSGDRVWERAKEMWGKGVHKDLRSTMFYL
ncbi:Piwi-domain-containing protein [Phellopilus nigrolimitatus]|nr:Piwi-domain-containing protein [Phellopilus nigrolimitatus]